MKEGLLGSPSTHHSFDGFGASVGWFLHGSASMVPIATHLQAAKAKSEVEGEAWLRSSGRLRIAQLSSWHGERTGQVTAFVLRGHRLHTAAGCSTCTGEQGVVIVCNVHVRKQQGFTS